MELKTQKRLAAQLMKCSEKKVQFDNDRLQDIKESITKADIRGLIEDGAISKKKKRGVSRVRARKILVQKRKGRQKGAASRQGKRTARLPRKKEWMNAIRAQRELLKALREKQAITNRVYQALYMKCKGGFFRSRRHIKLYIKEHELAKDE